MPNVIIFGDSRHPSLRHEVAVPLPDPIGYLEADGSRTILAGSLDVPRLQALGDYEVVSFEELGLNELLAEGKPLGAAVRGCVVRACARLGIGEAVVPGDFPLELADELRAGGVRLTADGSPVRPAPAGEDAVRARGHPPRAASGRGGHASCARRAPRRRRADCRGASRRRAAGLRRERLRAARHAGDRRRRTWRRPARRGSGPIPSGVPIVVDIFPRDMASGCWGDITRTFCVGEPPAELAAWHRVRARGAAARDRSRPGRESARAS